MEVLRKFWSYVNIFKKQEAPTDKGTSFNLRAMHTINKISILMFFVAVVIIIIKWVT